MCVLINLTLYQQLEKAVNVLNVNYIYPRSVMSVTNNGNIIQMIHQLKKGFKVEDMYNASFY